MTTPNSPFLDHQGVESVDIESDVAALVALGMTVMRWGVHAVTGRRIALLHDGVASKTELMEVDERIGALDHTAFAVDHLPSAHRAALAAGCAEERPPFRLEAALAHTSFVRAPGGSLVQLVQYDEHSPDRAPWGRPSRPGG